MTTAFSSLLARHASSALICTLLAGTALVFAGCSGSEDPEKSSADADPAGDVTALNSEYVEIPFETAYASVHRVELPEGAALSPHQGGPRVVYSLQPYTVQFKTEETTTERTFDADEAHYHSGGVHEVVNTGDQSAAFLVFERTGGALPSSSANGPTLDERSLPKGATHEVVFDNDRMAVHRVALTPGTALPTYYWFVRPHSLSQYFHRYRRDDRRVVPTSS
jgi:quercetin dioxygenase-like cupin family protein